MLQLLNPWVILGFVVALGAAGVAGDLKGRSDESAKYELQIAKTREATQRIIDGQAAIANAASATYQTGNANAKVIYKTLTQTVDRLVDRPVYLNTCLDADGLQLANAALAGVAAATPSGPPAALPAAVPAH